VSDETSAPRPRPAKPRDRILVLTDNVSATQQISFAQPLARLAKAGEIELRMQRLLKAGMREIIAEFNPTIVIFSRCAFPGGVKLLSLLRGMKTVAVMAHLDDDLLDVPITIGQKKFDYYVDPVRLGALREVLDKGDLVYVSTPALGDVLVEHQVRTPIYRGQIYCSVEGDVDRPLLPATAPIIGYMATSGHSGDLELVAPVIERLMTEIPSLRFETFGSITPTERLARFGSRILHHAPEPNYEAFIDKLKDLGWWIGIAPLEDTRFNRCKADTKWVEYSLAGMAVVASDLPVYERACSGGGGVLAQGEDAWYAALNGLIRDGARRRAMVETAREKLRTVYSREALESQVLDMISKLHALRQSA
jgi:glycosyltransferase involved in cell wall biosynthesis